MSGQSVCLGYTMLSHKIIILSTIGCQRDARVKTELWHISWYICCVFTEEDADSLNQYCINEECSGYDTEDELFDLARAIINKSLQDGGEVWLEYNLPSTTSCFPAKWHLCNVIGWLGH